MQLVIVGGQTKAEVLEKLAEITPSEQMKNWRVITFNRKVREEINARVAKRSHEQNPKVVLWMGTRDEYMLLKLSAASGILIAQSEVSQSAFDQLKQVVSTNRRSVTAESEQFYSDYVKLYKIIEPAHDQYMDYLRDVSSRGLTKQDESSGVKLLISGKSENTSVLTPIEEFSARHPILPGDLLFQKTVSLESVAPLWLEMKQYFALAPGGMPSRHRKHADNMRSRLTQCDIFDGNLTDRRGLIDQFKKYGSNLVKLPEKHLYVVMRKGQVNTDAIFIYTRITSLSPIHPSDIQELKRLSQNLYDQGRLFMKAARALRSVKNQAKRSINQEMNNALDQLLK